MQTFGAYLVALLAASTELAAALPQRMDVVQTRNGGGTLSVPVRRNTANSKKHPAMALAKVYTKYGKEMPTRLRTIVDRHRASVAAKRSTSEGSVTNTPEEYDTEYLANIQIGTPAQTLPMDFDTGSSDLWVFSGETAASSVNGQTLYYPSKSSTAQKKSGYTWQISYGDGSSSSGDVYMDTVTIGNLTVSSQAVEAATTVSSEFTSDSAMSGLVGLAFSSINTVSPEAQNTFFANAMSSLDQPVFTADLKHDADGSYNFGYIDSSAYTGDIYYADLYNVSASYSGYWTFQSTGYAVGSGSTSSSTSSSTTSSTASTSTGSASSTGTSSTEKRSVALTSTTITGIADTGTTLLMLPDEVVTAYYSQVSGAEDSETEGGYVFSCDQTLPDFTFAVGDGQITVPGDYINWSPVDETNTTCYGGLQSDSDIGLSIFGDIALKAALVVFDGGSLRLGWAAKTTS
ncbi:Endothiapepsin [Cytospora mali]|uniref:Endothiapepsin n=1 Tax=Cytospora mali TaxID=578113 RepID=A0A194V3K6_CYTMA|nr:Endothiapepsin [Valsa mali var. pyri (nom. inval.)]